MPRAAVDVVDLLVRVKNSDDAYLAAVAREVAGLTEEGRLGEDDDEDGLLVLALLAATGTAEARVSVMVALRRLVECVGGESKERLASIEALSSIVRSLSRDVVAEVVGEVAVELHERGIEWRGPERGEFGGVAQLDLRQRRGTAAEQRRASAAWRQQRATHEEDGAGLLRTRLGAQREDGRCNGQ